CTASKLLHTRQNSQFHRTKRLSVWWRLAKFLLRSSKPRPKQRRKKRKKRTRKRKRKRSHPSQSRHLPHPNLRNVRQAKRQLQPSRPFRRQLQLSKHPPRRKRAARR